MSHIHRHDAPASGIDTLLADPFDDDLAQRLNDAEPSPRARRATVVLGGLVMAVAGFLGGVLVQQNFGATQSGNAGGLPFTIPNVGASAFAGGGFGQGTTRRGGGATTGTVTLVDGDTIYITTTDGTVLTVKTTDDTTITTSTKSKLKDLKTGAEVSMRGEAGADGVITATEVAAQK